LADGAGDEGNAWGTWQVSVRRQNDCLVANGYMLVGDSAWMPKPLDAGGIGPAIIAATIAGKDAVEALQAGDTSEKGLWKYNKNLAEDLKYCATINKVLVDHYHNFPETPEEFSEWHKTLTGHLEEAFALYK